MKIARLCLVILALMTTALYAKPNKGGSSTPSRTDGDYWFYCYSDPSTIYDCDGTACDCKAACEIICGGPCDWDDSCIAN